jgi:hypothetical protein
MRAGIPAGHSAVSHAGNSLPLMLDSGRVIGFNEQLSPPEISSLKRRLKSSFNVLKCSHDFDG